MGKSYYKLLFSVEPTHTEDEDFVDKLAENIWLECENYLDLEKHPFVLRIGEYHHGHEKYTWEAELQVGDIGDGNLVRLSAVHEYYAINQANFGED